MCIGLTSNSQVVFVTFFDTMCYMEVMDLNEDPSTLCPHITEPLDTGPTLEFPFYNNMEEEQN